MKPRAILLTVGVSIAGVVAACAVHHGSQREPFQAKDVTGVPWGRGFELNDTTGERRALADFRGKVVLLSFGYTSCPDICPMTLALIGGAIKDLGPDAQRVQALFVTLDPERDTPERLGPYVASFDPSLMALYADPQETQRMADEFKIHYHAHRQAAEGTYVVDHSDPIYLFDAAGHLRLLVHPEALAPEAVVHDVRLLLREEDQAKAM